MRGSLAPMLFDEPDPAAREAQRTSPVAKAEPSPAAQRKAARKRTDPADGEPLPVHSFHTLLGDLATLTRNPPRPRSPHHHPHHPYPHTAPRLRSARGYPHRVDRPTPPLQNYINGLRSKDGKVRVRRILDLERFDRQVGVAAAAAASLAASAVL